MTDPLLYACLENLREKLLITRNEAGVTVVEKAIEEIERLDVDLTCANEEIERLNNEVETYKKIIQDTLKILPIEHASEHTAEMIPDMVREWVERAEQAEEELTELRDRHMETLETFLRADE